MHRRSKTHQALPPADRTAGPPAVMKSVVCPAASSSSLAKKKVCAATDSVCEDCTLQATMLPLQVRTRRSSTDTPRHLLRAQAGKSKCLQPTVSDKTPPTRHTNCTILPFHRGPAWRRHQAPCSNIKAGAVPAEQSILLCSDSVASGLYTWHSAVHIELAQVLALATFVCQIQVLPSALQSWCI